MSVGLSDTFTVNWTPSEFTKQPQGTTIVNGSTYTFTWDTTFDARVRILYWDTEYNDWSNGGETTGHSFSVTKNTTQAITYKVVADIPYTMANGATNYVWDVATSQSFIVSWVEDVPEEFMVTYNSNGGTGSIIGDTVVAGGTFILSDCTFTAPIGKQFAGWAVGSINATPLKQAGEQLTITGQTVIYAVWDDIPHNHDHGTTWESDANNHWNECSCGDKANIGAHEDSDNNGKCDTCDYQMTNVTPNNPEQPKDGLGTGAIIGIVVGGVVVFGLGGFAIFWFVIKKKSFADLIAIFKKK
ncbi:MAG: hypothetical protein IJY57_02120 [Clostridia bacterium]|nr:hypothetical protein [Clostridia bacterium]